MDTQWRSGGMGGVIGLDYTVVDGRAASIGLTMDTTYFMKVRAYEHTALEIINNRTGNKEVCDEKKKAYCQVQYGEFYDWACKNCKEINNG